jgi:hypothetical protein
MTEGPFSRGEVTKTGLATTDARQVVARFEMTFRSPGVYAWE